MRRRRTGGFAALIEATTFIFGFVMFATVLADYTSGDLDPRGSVAFIGDNQATLYLWNFVILIVFGVALVPLVLSLHETLKKGAPMLAQGAAAFGLIWAGVLLSAGMITNVGYGTVVDLHDTNPALAGPVWSALDSVQNGLSGGNELLGGLWVLLASCAALRSGLLSKRLNYLGMAAGAAGLVTIVPTLEAVGAIFGLGMIIWFLWLGLTMLREDPVVEAPQRRDLAGGRLV